ncbi:MAG TPA: DUF4126 domain-containing protein [Micromonosporaceae bacterium]|nr:DUF4126 domain-containing protein [Micromonosporaceae bacterium]
MNVVTSVAVGIGLAAACGFRLFVPFLVLGVAARLGEVPLTSGFAWLASNEALIALTVATVLEAAAYKVPWLDHLLDLLTSPAAVIAGMLASAAVVTDLPPLLRWGAIVIGGGGAAALVQGATVLARVKSAVTTGGLGNPLVALWELGSALVTSVLAILAPFLALLLLALGFVGILILIVRFSRSKGVRA